MYSNGQPHKYNISLNVAISKSDIKPNYYFNYYKCKYKLKQDLHKIDPKKRLYMEMIVEFSSIKKGDTSK